MQQLLIPYRQQGSELNGGAGIIRKGVTKDLLKGHLSFLPYKKAHVEDCAQEKPFYFLFKQLPLPAKHHVRGTGYEGVDYLLAHVGA